MARFQPGKSGNPKGKPRGAVNKTTKLRQSIEKDLPSILDALVAQAKQGDATAAKLLLDRCMPALKPMDQHVALPLGGDLAASGRATLAAVGASEVTPEQGAKILQGLGTLARIIETDELLKRIEKLEAANATPNPH